MRNVRSRLYLLVIIATLPFILYIITTQYQNVQAKKHDELTRLSSIANLTAAQHKQITEGARQLLIALASTSSVTNKNQSDCSTFLSNLLSNYIRYENFGVIDQSGRIRCASNLEQALKYPPSQNLIKNTLITQSFTVGSYYQIDATRAVLNFSYPISSNEIVYASLSLDWVSNFINELNPVDNIVINVLDRDGTVLARSPQTPDAIGKNFATDPLVQEILYQGSGQTTKVGIDQILRLYAFTSLDDSRTTFIAVGTPQSQIYTNAKRSLYLSLLSIVSITGISFLLAYQIGQVLIIKQVESLEQIDKLKDEFVSLASHQIRSPLTAIRWLSESLLESKLSITSNQHAMLGKIHTTTLRLITLTSNLLNISRLEAGSLTPHYKQVDLSELISSVITESKTGLNQLTIKLKPLSRKSSFIITDPLLVREILLVLVSNAIKYAHPHTPIKITVDRSQSLTNIRVKNQGIGIPKSASQNIFTRFYRADNARMQDPNGNGLGLYLANLITQKLGGNLSYISNTKHTTFTLTLPSGVL